jgi:hypothetical protein
MGSFSVTKLARNIISKGRDVVTRVPPQPVVTFRQGQVVSVGDALLPNADITLGGSTTVIPSVTVLQAYSPDNPPAAGHYIWAVVNGPDVVILGQHIATQGAPPIVI